VSEGIVKERTEQNYSKSPGDSSSGRVGKEKEQCVGTGRKGPGRLKRYQGL